PVLAFQYWSALCSHNVRGTYLPHSLRYDLSLAPRVVQFRLDMRMIADRAGLLFGKAGTRISLRGLTTGLRFLLRGGELLIVSLILQAGLALPMAYYFHRVTTIGLPANLLVIPLTELLMPSTLLAVGISYISLFWARIPAAGCCIRSARDQRKRALAGRAAGC